MFINYTKVNTSYGELDISNIPRSIDIETPDGMKPVQYINDRCSGYAKIALIFTNEVRVDCDKYQIFFTREGENVYASKLKDGDFVLNKEGPWRIKLKKIVLNKDRYYGICPYSLNGKYYLSNGLLVK